MLTKYNNSTTIRLDPELKDWLYTRCQRENRSLANLINTILKQEKDGYERITPLGFTGTANKDK